MLGFTALAGAVIVSEIVDSVVGEDEQSRHQQGHLVDSRLERSSASAAHNGHLVLDLGQEILELLDTTASNTMLSIR